MSDEPSKVVSVAAVSMVLHGRSLDIPTTPHPNKMPFSGVLTFLDEPSDGAPDGANGQRVMITSEAATKETLDSLLGMAVDYTPDWAGHDPQNKIGVITASEIRDIDGKKAIWVSGYIYAADFPDAAQEIKENKSELGMSFEARNLWTTDPKANPIPIHACVFTGAAILLKDKAAYRSTSISAAAKNAAHSSKEFTMDENTKKELTEMLAAALKPVSDSLNAQAAKIAELEKLPENIAKVQAANHLEKVEPHAKRLEEVADKMDAAGIGGDPNNGHAVLLRKMAGAMRAEAAQGKMPHAFHAFYAASTEPKADDAVKVAVDAVRAEMEKKIEEMKASSEKALAETKDELEATKTKLADVKAKEVAGAERPARKTVELHPMHEKLLAKSALKPDAESGKISMDELNAFLKTAGLSSEKRIEFKSGLARAGLID